MCDLQIKDISLMYILHGEQPQNYKLIQDIYLYYRNNNLDHKFPKNNLNGE